MKRLIFLIFPTLIFTSISAHAIAPGNAICEIETAGGVGVQDRSIQQGIWLHSAFKFVDGYVYKYQMDFPDKSKWSWSDSICKLKSVGWGSYACTDWENKESWQGTHYLLSGTMGSEGYLTVTSPYSAPTMYKLNCQKL